MGRTQELLYFIREIKDQGLVKSVPDFPVYIDSPLAKAATTVFCGDLHGYLDEAALELVKDGTHMFSFPNLHLVETTEESRMLNLDKTPKIIISASGMCDAGEFNDKTGDIIGLRQINPNDDVLLITNNGTTIRIKSNDVRKVGRNSMGVRMMKLRSGNSIASFATVEADANEPEEENTDGLPTASEFAENFEKQEQELAQNENAQDSEIATEPQSEVENENLENDENTQE